MKTTKTLFAILFLSTLFFACESDSINEETGIDLEEVVGTEDAGTEDIEPTRG